MDKAYVCFCKSAVWYSPEHILVLLPSMGGWMKVEQLVDKLDIYWTDLKLGEVLDDLKEQGYYEVIEWPMTDKFRPLVRLDIISCVSVIKDALNINSLALTTGGLRKWLLAHGGNQYQL